jgi:hypothetical protein
MFQSPFESAIASRKSFSMPPITKENQTIYEWLYSVGLIFLPCESMYQSATKKLEAMLFAGTGF